MNKLIVLGMIAGLVVAIPGYAYAEELTGIYLLVIGDTEVSLSDHESKRDIRVFAIFANFDLSANAFAMQITSPDSEIPIYTSDVSVFSSKTGFANFGTFVIFNLSNEIAAQTDIEPGEYELVIVTQNGSAESVPITIVE